MHAIRTFLRNNSLSIAFLGLFVVCLGGEWISGRASYNTLLASHHLPGVGYLQFLHTGQFLDGMAANWEAAILQLTCLVLFEGIMAQKGAAHSRKPGSEATRPQRRRAIKRYSWLYDHSLGLALGAMFLTALLGHIVFGTWAYNELNRVLGQAPISYAAYAASGDFWFKLLQTWEAEFGAIGVFIVLSIYLREIGSAESKPVGSSNAETGETNA